MGTSALNASNAITIPQDITLPPATFSVCPVMKAATSLVSKLARIE